MSSISPPQRKSPSKDKHEIKAMVQSLVTNLESFHDEMSVVIDDMKELVSQIDNVQSKIENAFGKSLSGPDVLHTNVKKNDLTEHHYENIELRPKIQSIEEKINSKLCSIQTQSTEIKSYLQTQNYQKRYLQTQLCQTNNQVIRPNSFSEPLTESDSETELKTINAQRSYHILDSLESPMLDLSYLGIKQSDGRPRWSRSISMSNGDTTANHWSPEGTTDIRLTEESPCNSNEMVTTPKVFCFAELKKTTSVNSKTSVFDEVFDNLDVKTVSPTTGTTVKSITSSSMISNVSIDGDVYERQLDGDLDNIGETSDESLLLESSDDSMETSSNAHTEAHSDTLECNTWTLFTMNPMTESTKSSDSFVSDTPSDIINDNIWPPNNLVDIFSNSMLANKLNKHNDNNFFSLPKDINYKD